MTAISPSHTVMISLSFSSDVSVEVTERPFFTKTALPYFSCGHSATNVIPAIWDGFGLAFSVSLADILHVAVGHWQSFQVGVLSPNLIPLC